MDGQQRKGVKKDADMPAPTVCACVCVCAVLCRVCIMARTKKRHEQHHKRAQKSTNTHEHAQIRMVSCLLLNQLKQRLSQEEVENGVVVVFVVVALPRAVSTSAATMVASDSMRGASCWSKKRVISQAFLDEDRGDDGLVRGDTMGFLLVVTNNAWTSSPRCTWTTMEASCGSYWK